MEYILIIVIIGILFHLKNTFTSKTDSINENIKSLNEKLDELLKAKNISEEVKKEWSPIKEQIKEATARSAESVIPIHIPVKEKSELIIDKVEEKTANPIKEKEPLKVVEGKTASKVADKTESKTANWQSPPKQKEKIKKEPTLSLWERFKEKNPDLEKFVGENLINKIGVLILVLGISYFVKFAIDKEWINEPARVGIGILAGALVLGIAHKLRKNYAAFSSVLVAGAIAIFYFTIAIAFQEYQLFSQTVAFTIMVSITAFSCLISLSYDRMELAILSLIGGFAVPFMISTGSGNYVVLFSYIAILDIGILALAYFKKWNLVNILAFIFTTLLFGGWIVKEINEAAPHYLGGLVFGFIFYFIFVLTNIINNLRTKGEFTKPQLAILAINTLVFYGIGMVILSNFHPEFKGLFTTVLALLNLVYAWFLYKKFGLDKTAVYLLVGLTLTFITLAIPIQFKGNYITLFWAVEAVLLMWLANKSQLKSYRFAATLVQILMLCSLVVDWFDFYTGKDLKIVFNPIFITGITAVVSLVGIRYLLRNETQILRKYRLTFNPVKYKRVAGIVAIIVGYLVGLFEVGYQSDQYIVGTSSAIALPIVYHIIYSAVLCFFLYRNKTETNYKLLNVLAIVNVVVFAFVFSKAAFSEQKESVITGEVSKIAFYLHYISLILVVYFGWLIYKTNNREKVFQLFNNRFAIWIAAFMIVFIASTEVILHGLQLSDLQITTEQLNAELTYSKEVGYYQKARMANNNIEQVKLKLIKTALPVLWGIMAFVFLIFGIKKQLKPLRIIALSLIGLTIVKLFAYDISNASETGKIVAVILLGVIILIISFVYQKIKVLVIDEEKTPDNETLD